MRKMISIIGDSRIDEDGDKFKIAFEIGKLLVDHGYRVASGGLKGAMNAVMLGAKSSEFYKEGDTVAILPMFDRNVETNGDIVIATGLDIYRNVIVGNSDAVIMIGGGAGTLSECANAWALKRLIVAIEGVEGWSDKVANTRLDQRIRYPEIPEDKIYGAKTADEAIALIEKYIDKYVSAHEGIKPGN